MPNYAFKLTSVNTFILFLQHYRLNTLFCRVIVNVIVYTFLQYNNSQEICYNLKNFLCVACELCPLLLVFIVFAWNFNFAALHQTGFVTAKWRGDR